MLLNHQGSPIYTLPSVKQGASGKLLYSRELGLVLYDYPEGWDVQVGGRSKREGTYVYLIADSLCGSAETNTTL